MAEPAANEIVFNEVGSWQPPGRAEHRFTNVFRWSCIGNVLRLEHLRFGVEHPVHLFDMAPTESGEWRDVSPHQCRADCYSASLSVEGDRVLVAWSIRGPRKQETIRYTYT